MVSRCSGRRQPVTGDSETVPLEPSLRSPFLHKCLFRRISLLKYGLSSAFPGAVSPAGWLAGCWGVCVAGSGGTVPTSLHALPAGSVLRHVLIPELDAQANSNVPGWHKGSLSLCVCRVPAPTWSSSAVFALGGQPGVPGCAATPARAFSVDCLLTGPPFSQVLMVPGCQLSPPPARLFGEAVGSPTPSCWVGRPPGASAWRVGAPYPAVQAVSVQTPPLREAPELGPVGNLWAPWDPAGHLSRP